MDYPKFIVSNQKEEFISIQRVDEIADMCWDAALIYRDLQHLIWVYSISKDLFQVWKAFKILDLHVIFFLDLQSSLIHNLEKGS